MLTCRRIVAFWLIDLAKRSRFIVPMDSTGRFGRSCCRTRSMGRGCTSRNGGRTSQPACASATSRTPTTPTSSSARPPIRASGTSRPCIPCADWTPCCGRSPPSQRCAKCTSTRLEAMLVSFWDSAKLAAKCFEFFLFSRGFFVCTIVPRFQRLFCVSFYQTRPLMNQLMWKQF